MFAYIGNAEFILYEWYIVFVFAFMHVIYVTIYMKKPILSFISL